MKRPLDGILVVALEQAIAAPLCTRQLADLGARVIKIERPDGGDFARAYDTRARGLSSHFVWTNRSKESLALDLKKQNSLKALERILEAADVLVTNLSPGALDRLGLSTRRVRADHPKLIYCRISGFGSGGPDSSRKAYDLLIQAEAGLLSVTGTPDTIAKAGISIADIAAGTAACQAVLAALLQRARTGTGDHIDVSMLEAMAEWMGFPLYYALDGAEPPGRSGAAHATIYPYGPYDAADGTVLFAVQNDREWAAFARIVLMRPDWAEDKRFEGNSNRDAQRAVIEPEIRAVLSRLSVAEAHTRLSEAGLGVGRVNDMASLWVHPQLAVRQRWATVETEAGPLPALLPITADGWNPRMDPVPSLGKHTASLVEEFGLHSLLDEGPSGG